MDEFENFRRTVERFGWVGGLAVAGATFAPLVTAAAGVATPWPVGLPFFTSVFMLITLISTFLFTGSLSRRTFTRSFVGLVIAFVLLLGGYLYSFDRFVRTVPDAPSVILGCTYLPDTRLVIKDSGHETGNECPGPAARMLENAGFDPAGMWTEESLSAIKLLLVALWLGMFSALAGVLGIFVMRVSRRRRGVAEAAAPVPPDETIQESQ